MKILQQCKNTAQSTSIINNTISFVIVFVYFSFSNPTRNRHSFCLDRTFCSRRLLLLFLLLLGIQSSNSKSICMNKYGPNWFFFHWPEDCRKVVRFRSFYFDDKFFFFIDSNLVHFIHHFSSIQPLEWIWNGPNFSFPATMQEFSVYFGSIRLFSFDLFAEGWGVKERKAKFERFQTNKGPLKKLRG